MNESSLIFKRIFYMSCNGKEELQMMATKKDITLVALIDEFNSLLIGELLARSGDIDEPANKALKRLKDTLEQLTNKKEERK